jgi:hypothetical protein
MRRSKKNRPDQCVALEKLRKGVLKVKEENNGFGG